MSAQPTSFPTPQGQLYCLLFIKSFTGKLQSVYVPIPDNETPEAFMATAGQKYKAYAPKAKRLFYHCLMFQKETVSIAKLSTITSSAPTAATTGNNLAFVETYARDAILTASLHKPSILRSANRAGFRERYKDVVVNAGHNKHPEAAMLIHLETNPVAVKVFSILVSVISSAVAAGVKFAP